MNSNVHNVKAGDVVQFTNRHKNPITVWEYTYTIKKCCPKKVFFYIRNDKVRAFCSYWEHFNAKWEDLRGEVIDPSLARNTE